jgi:hypothetical protein
MRTPVTVIKKKAPIVTGVAQARKGSVGRLLQALESTEVRLKPADFDVDAAVTGAPPNIGSPIGLAIAFFLSSRLARAQWSWGVAISF